MSAKRAEEEQRAAAAEAASATRPTEPETTAADGAPAEAELEHDIEELLAAKAKSDEYLAVAQRTQADFENYRKRVAREAAAAEARGRLGLLRELLPVVDNLERALAAAEPRIPDQPEDRLAEGVRLVLEELRGALARNGVESYVPVGERFDPEWHEAVTTKAGAPEDAGRVAEVMAKGYKVDGELLRPAQVVVSE